MIRLRRSCSSATRARARSARTSKRAPRRSSSTDRSARFDARHGRSAVSRPTPTRASSSAGSAGSPPASDPAIPAILVACSSSMATPMRRSPLNRRSASSASRPTSRTGTNGSRSTDPMASLIDRALAIIGWFAAAVQRLAGGSRKAPTRVALALFVLTAIPIGLVSTSHRPTDLSFEDMRLERLPGLTSWGRLEGELHRTQSAFGGLYELHDTKNPDLYVIVITDADLPDGHAMVTGRVSPRFTSTGNAGSVDADVPAVPRVDEPIWLYLTPAVVGLLLLLGQRLGYPVVRGDRRSEFFRAQVADGEPVPVEWSGRIGKEVVERGEARRATVAVAQAPDATEMDDLTIADEGRDAARTTRLRQHAAIREVRLCHLGRSEPGLELHPAASDIVLAFPDRAARDRLVARLL